MNKNLLSGKEGEDVASKYLENKGYIVLDRNYRRKFGEIDIICRSRDKTLVFAEVKFIRQLPDSGSIAGLLPEDNLSMSKLMKLRKMASGYANANPQLIDEGTGWRIDLLALTLLQNSGSIPSKSNGLTKDGRNYKINHYQNI